MNNSTCISEFENYLKFKNYSASSIRSYSSAVAHFLRHFGESPRNITLKQVREYLTGIANNATQRHSTSALSISMKRTSTTRRDANSQWAPASITLAN